MKNNESKETAPLYNVSSEKEYKSMDDIFNESNISGRFVIPGVKNVDWMVPVAGNGMYPKYSNGDILLCRVVNESFIQWGKVHVIVTKTGLFTRKLKPSSKENFVMAETYSDDYPPFDIPKDEIIGLAIVVAAIKFE